MTDNNSFRFCTESEVYDLPNSRFALALETVQDSGDVFDEDGFGVQERPVPGYESAYKYIPFGVGDALPYYITSTIGRDEILSQNMLFNVLTCYGSGLQYVNPATGGKAVGEPADFFLRNSLKKFYLNQATDMKYFFFAVAVIILDRAGEKIVQVRHKEASYCRFEKADKNGRINHVFYANWRKMAGNLGRKDVEVLQLLDEINPLGHLEVLMGKAVGSDGEKRMRTTNRKFAIVMKVPTPGLQYYPTPYYTAIFRGDWFDIKRLIGKGKKAKIRNHGSIKYHVEINARYWEDIINAENIVDPLAQQERIKKEKENIKNFVCGIENSGKVWITGCYTTPDGKEEHLVRVNMIDNTKEGGDWSDDISEAANMLCYATNIHPNLVGANPGKSQSNNSGSDKRELFTLKQSLEVAFRDMLTTVHDVIINFNGWAEQASAEVPIILLTTLDKGTDAKKVSPSGAEGEVNN